MIRSALLVAAAILAAATAACTPPPPAPPPPPLRARVATSCDASAFLAKVSLLAPNFDPSLRGSNYRPPQSVGSVPGYMAQDLGDAYCAAPPDFAQQLLQLTQVFVNQDACADPACPSHSWAYRERPDQQPGTGEYIAISAALWPTPNASAMKYHAFETVLLRQLLGWPANDNNPPIYAPGAGDPNTDTPKMTIMAALAHEYGHLLWYDIVKPNRGGGNNLKNLCNGEYFTDSWRSVHTPPIWRHFENRNQRNNYPPIPDKHASGVQTTQIDNAIANGNLDTAASYLSQLLAVDQPWASFFGSISPDEDVVESFKLDVLSRANPPLMSMPLTIRNATPQNVAYDYYNHAKVELSNKIACIGASEAMMFRTRLR